MLGKHFLDIDVGNDRRILLQRADIDLIRAARRVDGAQFLAVDQFDFVPNGRIVGDASPEFLFVCGAMNLAEQIDGGAGDEVVGCRQVFARDLRDHGNDDGVGAADADKTADRRPHLGGACLAVSHQADPRQRAAYENHASKRCHDC